MTMQFPGRGTLLFADDEDQVALPIVIPLAMGLWVIVDRSHTTPLDSIYTLASAW